MLVAGQRVGWGRYRHRLSSRFSHLERRIISVGSDRRGRCDIESRVKGGHYDVLGETSILGCSERVVIGTKVRTWSFRWAPTGIIILHDCDVQMLATYREVGNWFDIPSPSSPFNVKFES